MNKFKELGRINIEDTELSIDYLEAFIPIVSVSTELRNRISESMETTMQYYQTDVLNQFGLKWCEDGSTITSINLHIILYEDHIMSYEVCVNIEDIENPSISADFSLMVDLSDYINELTKLVLKTVIDKFF